MQTMILPSLCRSQRSRVGGSVLFIQPSAASHSHRDSFDTVALVQALATISGKWKARLVCLLFDGKKRYGELRRGLPGITQCVLTSQLRELQKAGVVSRTVYPTTPPAVEYSLTARGQALRTVFRTLKDWAENGGAQLEEPAANLG
jgi:DNA-binding HxlR family transcriptional regulator